MKNIAVLKEFFPYFWGLEPLKLAWFIKIMTEKYVVNVLSKNLFLFEVYFKALGITTKAISFVTDISIFCIIEF